MTIAEAGPVGRIKRNFSVMVRGVGFSTLIISSASQSRPLSRLYLSCSHASPSFPRAPFSLSFGFATGIPSLLGIHFHAFSWATRPFRTPLSLPSHPSVTERPVLPPSALQPTTFVILTNLLFARSLFLSLPRLSFSAFSPFFLAL